MHNVMYSAHFYFIQLKAQVTCIVLEVEVII